MPTPATLVYPDLAPILPALPPNARVDDLPEPSPHRDPDTTPVLH